MTALCQAVLFFFAVCPTLNLHEARSTRRCGITCSALGEYAPFFLRQHLIKNGSNTFRVDSSLYETSRGDIEGDIDHDESPMKENVQGQSQNAVFFDLMSPEPSTKPDQMSASALAYLGDVLFELFVRSRYVWPSRRMSVLQDKVVSIVRADAQSILLKKFIQNFPLTVAERGVLARGRNANLTAKKKNRNYNKSSDDGGGVSAYQDSTALEALLGYTYINDKKRFGEMMKWMQLELDEWDKHF